MSNYSPQTLKDSSSKQFSATQCNSESDIDTKTNESIFNNDKLEKKVGASKYTFSNFKYSTVFGNFHRNGSVTILTVLAKLAQDMTNV